MTFLRTHWRFVLRTLLSANFVVLVWFGQIPWWILGPWVTVAGVRWIVRDWIDESRHFDTSQPAAMFAGRLTSAWRRPAVRSTDKD